MRKEVGRPRGGRERPRSWRGWVRREQPMARRQSRGLQELEKGVGSPASQPRASGSA